MTIIAKGTCVTCGQPCHLTKHYGWQHDKPNKESSKQHFALTEFMFTKVATLKKGKMNYTRGTWTVRDTNIGTLIEIPSDNERIEIALLPHGPDTAANARLMASSPDMLETLKKIASCDSHIHGDVVDIAQKALAKVEGK